MLFKAKRRNRALSPANDEGRVMRPSWVSGDVRPVVCGPAYSPSASATNGGAISAPRWMSAL